MGVLLCFTESAKVFVVNHWKPIAITTSVIAAAVILGIADYKYSLHSKAWGKTKSAGSKVWGGTKRTGKKIAYPFKKTWKGVKWAVGKFISVYDRYQFWWIKKNAQPKIDSAAEVPKSTIPDSSKTKQNESINSENIDEKENEYSDSGSYEYTEEERDVTTTICVPHQPQFEHDIVKFGLVKTTKRQKVSVKKGKKTRPPKQTKEEEDKKDPDD